MINSEITQIRAAGGVLYCTEFSSKKVLLIKRNGFWDLPKGKLEEGESIEECAVREVEEETGVREVAIESFLCDTYHEYQQNGKNYGKTTSWYLMKSGNPNFNFEPQTEEGITEVKWAEPGEAKSLVEFENLVEVLNKLG